MVYLHVLPEILVERTRYDFNRPLLQVDNPLKKMQQLYATRDPIYRQTSHIVLDVGTENHYITFKKLLAKLSES